MKKNNFLYLLFAFTIFLGSFLLFQVQPIIGKYILPWFGGASFVWITSLLFFQTLLLAGYFYAYLLSKLSVKSQAILHSLLIVIAVGLILFFFQIRQSPIIPTLNEKPAETIQPLIQILSILFVSIGLPYFLLATTSTLLQKWFSALHHKKSPYSLYAISNIGSLLGLISYPFVIEPALAIQQQGLFWSNCFLLVCLLLFLCSSYILLVHKKTTALVKKQKEIAAIKATKQQLLVWFTLPAISSLMLLAATNQLTQSIAPIPFLWLLPLCLYLISFILCFSKKGLYHRSLNAVVFLCTTLLVVALLVQSAVILVSWQLMLYTLLLFSAFMLCHGELYAQRPDARSLQLFYLLISFGSVIGAGIVAIIAPIFFIGMFWEFYLGLYATTLVAAFALIASPNSLLLRLFLKILLSKKEAAFFLFFLTSCIFCLLLVTNYIAQISASVGIWRNFYGTQRVTHQQKPNGTFACLLNGKIIHGCQLLAKNLKNQPLTYYGKGSGVSLGIESLRTREKNIHIGVIGLGVGTIAAYGEKGDAMTFYELNPQNITIAQTQFSYLSNSKADINVVEGDGRLSLAKEVQQKNSTQDNLLIIDAFTDDAIPLHLLTKEAFALYREKLTQKNSMIIVNISTTYVDLAPVIIQLAHHFGMATAIISTSGEGEGIAASRWALITSDPKLLQTNSITKNKEDLSKIHSVPLWTDDYSNVFQLLKY